MAIHNVKLTYFAGQGRGELTRLVLSYLGIPFEDNRIEVPAWPALKPTFPLAQVPVLEFDDDQGHHRVMTQSYTIARSVARCYGFDGKSPKESSYADEANECMREVLDAATKVVWEADAAKKEQLAATLNNEHIPRVLNYLEKILKENGGHYIAGGDSFTYADLAVVHGVKYLAKEIKVVPNVAFRSPAISLQVIEDKYPSLAALIKSVESNPNIAAYLAKRPDTSF